MSHSLREMITFSVSTMVWKIWEIPWCLVGTISWPVWSDLCCSSRGKSLPSPSPSVGYPSRKRLVVSVCDHWIFWIMFHSLVYGVLGNEAISFLAKHQVILAINWISKLSFRVELFLIELVDNGGKPVGQERACYLLLSFCLITIA